MRSRGERVLRGLRVLLLIATTLVALQALAVLSALLGVREGRAPGAVLAVTVLVLMALVVAAAVVGWLLRRVPRSVVLLLDLSEPITDLPRDDPRRRLGTRARPGLRDTVEALERAAVDPRVAGLWCRIGRPASGVGTAQELRDGIRACRDAGKLTVAFAESFGEFGPGTVGYYVATACDTVLLQPSGDVGLTGVAAEVSFVRGTLDKLGVSPELDHREAYKSAKNRLTERAFTPAHREATERVVGATFEQVVEAIAEGRGLGAAAVRALVDRGPFTAPEALDAGLVDDLCYRDESLARARARARAGDGARLLALADYRRRAPSRRRRGARPTVVALVHGVGAVTTGRSRLTPLTVRSMGSDTVGAALRAAVRDKRVSGILFRVDSPGGSYVGADAIWREVVRAREAGTPVVVSMGDVAGSGGYFVSMAADRIVAHPGTLTGSIGVVVGKAVVAGLRERAGLTDDEAHAGAHALMWSSRRDYSASEWDRVEAWLDRCYDDFTAKVAQSRGMDLDSVRAVAQGRVWVGQDAAERGLVDTLGGYRAALGELRGVLGLAPDAPLRVVPFPRRASLLARLVGARPEPEEELAPRGPGAALTDPALLLGDLTRAASLVELMMPAPWRVR